MNIESLSTHKKQFQTSRMKVPAIFFMSEELLPQDETWRKMEDIASNPDTLFRSLVAMPDVCSKPGRKNASGTVIVSEKYILPQVNDSDPNCGMRLLKTNLTEDNFSPENIDKLFQDLVKAAPTKKFVGTKIPFNIVVDICRKGTRAIVDHLGIKTKTNWKTPKTAAIFSKAK